VVYSGGVIKHTGVLAIGGDHVSNDLAFGLKVPLGRAEQLKIENGSALMDDAIKGRTMNITSELGLPLNTVNLEHLHRIMTLRLEELFQLIAQDLEQAGLLEYLRAGVFLCGGGARVPASPNSPPRCSNCRLHRKNHLGQRSEVHARSTGVCHPHRPGEIRLLQVAQTRCAALTGAKPQKRFQQNPAALTERCHGN